LRINKNDIWDARLDTSGDSDLPTLRRLKELAYEDWPGLLWVIPRGQTPSPKDSYNDQPYPCPRGCAIVRIGERQTFGPRWRAKLRLTEASGGMFRIERQSDSRSPRAGRSKTCF